MVFSFLSVGLSISYSRIFLRASLVNCVFVRLRGNKEVQLEDSIGFFSYCVECCWREGIVQSVVDAQEVCES